MKSKFILLLSILLSISMITTSAEARRFGGVSRGFSKSWSRGAQSTPKATYIPKKRTYNQDTTQKTTKRTSFLKGAMMGLLAGGLIGSLMSGHGFSGFHFMDLFLLMGLGFLIFKIIAYVRRSQRDYHESKN